MIIVHIENGILKWFQGSPLEPLRYQVFELKLNNFVYVKNQTDEKTNTEKE